MAPKKKTKAAPKKILEEAAETIPKNTLKKAPKKTAEKASKQTHNKAAGKEPFAKTQAMPVEKDKKKTFPFMRLPPELREIVYEQVLVREPVIDASAQRSNRYLSPRLPHNGFLGRNGACILRTNRLLCNEALPILYGGNTFEFDSWIGAYAFGRSVRRSAGAQYLRHVIYSAPARYDIGSAMLRLREIEVLPVIVKVFRSDIAAETDDKSRWDGNRGVIEGASYLVNMAGFEKEWQAQFDKISFVYDDQDTSGSTLPFPLEDLPSKFKTKVAERLGIQGPGKWNTRRSRK